MKPQSTYECEWCVDGLQADGETPCPCQEADLPRQVRDLKRALAEAKEKIERLEAQLVEADKHARAIEALLEPHVDWEGGPPSRATAAEARADRLEKALTDIAESEDVDNALDPERNRRIARAALQQEPA